MIEVKVDERKLRQVQLMMAGIPRGLGLVMSRAINRTLTSVRAEVVRRESKMVTAPQRYIRRAIRFVEKATTRKLSAVINIMGKRISLAAFSSRQTKKGVSFKIQRGGGKGFIPHAFQINNPGGKVVFKRTTAGWQGGKREGVEFEGTLSPGLADAPVVGRLPIGKIFGPSPGAIFERMPGLSERLQAFAGQTLEKNADSQMKFLLGKSFK